MQYSSQHLYCRNKQVTYVVRNQAKILQLMIETMCINDSNKPKEIPVNKWIKKDEKYTVIYTVTVLPQKQLAFHLAEIDLDESCHPYTYFLASRFAFTEENLLKLIELIKDCSDTDFSLTELLEQTQLEELI